ncbi:restriction endonuclease subunit S [Acidithrix sp. C25]|uniref:restriction endonuclease subunit S n=1 Tax=Acidithrix sp. C25 TaxID=1671482 RepID=UPI00191BB7CD|nr:restriction endonuclease subunit S [Acidithrix sp. C25]CAG4927368.1 unnamed protein product [Acidithrix sp. C25]
MKATLTAYPTYKESGSLWLGDVPEHWKTHALWTISKLRNERTLGALQLLSVFLNRGVIRYEEGGGQVHAPSLDLTNYQVVHAGDLVLNNQQAWRGSVGVSCHHGIISPAYIVLELPCGIDSEFANYLVRCPAIVDQFVIASKGVGDIQRQIFWPFLRYVQIPLPPLDEQAVIVKFLNYMDRRIRRYIGAKQKLIKLLEEQKQAIIHRAITRGLDSDVRLKPSGVEWLGDVPEHWKVERLKYLAKMNPSRTELDELASNTVVTVLPMENVSEWGQIDSSRTSELGSVNPGFTYMRDGDVIVAKITPCFENGKGAVCAGLANRVAFGSTEFHVLRPFARILPWYLYYLTREQAFRAHGAFNMRGSAGQQRVPTEFLASWYIPIPPVAEQRDIVASINQELHEINDTAERLHRQIVLLSQYRTRLIADVVTGKLDIREAAARLPDEQIESELLDEENTPMVDDEFEGSDDDLNTELEEVEA